MSVEKTTISDYRIAKGQQEATKKTVFESKPDNTRCPLSVNGDCTQPDPRRPGYVFECDGRYYKNCDVYRRTLK